jgi:hypothetical protein
LEKLMLRASHFATSIASPGNLTIAALRRIRSSFGSGNDTGQSRWGMMPAMLHSPAVGVEAVQAIARPAGPEPVRVAAR